MYTHCKCGQTLIWIGPRDTGSPVSAKQVVAANPNTKWRWHGLNKCEGYWSVGVLEL